MEWELSSLIPFVDDASDSDMLFTTRQKILGDLITLARTRPVEITLSSFLERDVLGLDCEMASDVIVPEVIHEHQLIEVDENLRQASPERVTCKDIGVQTQLTHHAESTIYSTAPTSQTYFPLEDTNLNPVLTQIEPEMERLDCISASCPESPTSNPDTDPVTILVLEKVYIRYGFVPVSLPYSLPLDLPTHQEVSSYIKMLLGFSASRDLSPFFASCYAESVVGYLTCEGKFKKEWGDFDIPDMDGNDYRKSERTVQTDIKQWTKVVPSWRVGDTKKEMEVKGLRLRAVKSVDTDLWAFDFSRIEPDQGGEENDTPSEPPSPVSWWMLCATSPAEVFSICRLDPTLDDLGLLKELIRRGAPFCLRGRDNRQYSWTRIVNTPWIGLRPFQRKGYEFDRFDYESRPIRLDSTWDPNYNRYRLRIMKGGTILSRLGRGDPRRLRFKEQDEGDLVSESRVDLDKLIENLEEEVRLNKIGIKKPWWLGDVFHSRGPQRFRDCCGYYLNARYETYVEPNFRTGNEAAEELSWYVNKSWWPVLEIWETYASQGELGWSEWQEEFYIRRLESLECNQSEDKNSRSVRAKYPQPLSDRQWASLLKDAKKPWESQISRMYSGQCRVAKDFLLRMVSGD
ncbi:hypothetical protein GALMADRAFT_158317 [Galerina marginata CBS 339.88]|uniref:Uncharacterized protein n=1 Tax=Galerina marginata (strain CBS 339.88) TaxID=685588 RepID=A0A067SQF9_GALM3|nr:hypothetical protein GALMADRAFT_158317 [Galerina marginata CBS 339.88]